VCEKRESWPESRLIDDGEGGFELRWELGAGSCGMMEGVGFGSNLPSGRCESYCSNGGKSSLVSGLRFRTRLGFGRWRAAEMRRGNR